MKNWTKTDWGVLIMFIALWTTYFIQLSEIWK